MGRVINQPTIWTYEKADISKHRPLVIWHPENPVVACARGRYFGAAKVPDIKPALWAVIIETTHETIDALNESAQVWAIQEPDSRNVHGIGMLFCDPRVIILDWETNEMIYNPRESLSFWGGAYPPIFDWLVENQGWGL